MRVWGHVSFLLCFLVLPTWVIGNFYEISGNSLLHFWLAYPAHTSASHRRYTIASNGFEQAYCKRYGKGISRSQTHAYTAQKRKQTLAPRPQTPAQAHLKRYPVFDVEIQKLKDSPYLNLS